MDVDLKTLSLDVNRPRSPLEGSHRALDGIGDFVAAADLQALCLVGKRFRRDSRVPADVREHVRVFVEDIALRARVQEFCDLLTDAQRDDVMKIVPRMVEGPWVAKHAVGQKPALLGHAITTAYHSGPGWFEMDVDVSSSSTAAGALRILKSCSKSLVMDLAFVLEGQTPDALPEKILGTVEWNHFDLDPDNSPVIKVCGEDN